MNPTALRVGRVATLSVIALAVLALLPGHAPAAAAGRATLAERCRAEVVELHQFLEDWSNAEPPNSDQAFARFDRVIAPEFRIIGPDGVELGRQPIVEAIRDAHGRWRTEPGRIRIENFRFRQSGGDLALATYEEWHDVGEPRGRLSTVLFRSNPDAPNGVEWLHLHEVWLQPPTEDGSAAESSRSALSDRLDRILTGLFPAGEPGAAVFLSHQGKMILHRAYGMADLELGVELEPEMVFRLGSITKQFTAAAILLLAEEGLLSVEEPITRYLPEYPVGETVPTVEHLLTHTSGIFSYTAIPGYMTGRVRLDLSTDELIAEFQDRPPDFAPGERWSYSNSGYVLLGAIIERVGGLSYADFIEQRIFEPLGMDHSEYGGLQIVPDRVSGYQTSGDGWVNASFLSMTQPHAAGGLLSTVGDLARWDAALHGGELLSPASYRRMTTRFRLADGSEADYGYGVSLSTLRGRPVIQHGGGIFGFNTFALRMPEENLFVAILSNAADRPFGPGPAALKIAALAIGDPFPELQRAEVDPTVLDRLAGVYEIETGGTRIATVEKGRLYTHRGGGARLEAIPAGEDLFFYDDSLTYFRVVEEDGKPVMLMHQDGADEPERAVWSGPPPVARQEVALPAEKLAAAVGRYELAPGFVLSLTLEDGRLMSQATGQAKVPLFAESEDRFFLKVVDAQLELVRNDRGEVTGLVLFQAGRRVPGRKLP